MTSLRGKTLFVGNFIRRRCVIDSRETVVKKTNSFLSQKADLGLLNKLQANFQNRRPYFQFLSASILSSCVLYFIQKKRYTSANIDAYFWNDLGLRLGNALNLRAECAQGPGMRARFNFIADIVEQAQPAVVFLEVVKGNERYGPKQRASGSGFIVRSDGLILTNAHVVAGASRVQVCLNDGEKVQGVVQAVDQVCDLATVKVQRNNLPTLPLGKSSEVRPGEWVVALGSPFNLQKTVTAGIVSNPGRETMGNLTKSPPMIQHDAIINVGNSGGPLINLDGEAIGINTMTLTSGISFALPADLAVDFLNRAKRVEGKFPKPAPKRHYVGLGVMSLTPDLQMNLKKMAPNFPTNVEQGIVIGSVYVGSPAHQAGLVPTDVITHINGKVVTSTSDYFKAIETGEKITLQIARSTGVFKVSIVPEDVD